MSYNVKISEDERDDFEMELKQVNTNKPYAFVSYANADIIQVQADVKRLQNAGINLWIDTDMSCSEDISGMHYGNKLPIIIIRVTQFTAIKSFCYEMAEEYGD